MNRLFSLLKEYDITVDKVEKWNDFWIIYSDKDKYLIKNKKRNINELFSYFDSIDYSYYMPLICSYNDSFELYPYFDDDYISLDIKAESLITTLAFLHDKSCLITNYSLEDKKFFYEKQINKIDECFNRYLAYQDLIDEMDFPTPDYYLLLCNISKIYEILKLARYYLDQWYNNSFTNIRKAMLVGDVSFDNFRVHDRCYFINYDFAKEDLVVYDFVSFYKCELFNCDMNSLFSNYQSKYPFRKEEKDLFYSLICLIDVVSFNKSIYENTILVREVLNYVQKTLLFLSEEDKKDQKTDEEILK